MPDDWNDPQVVFLSRKEQFAIVTLIKRAQRGESDKIRLLDSDSPILAKVYDRLAPDVLERMRNSLLPEDEEENS